MGRQDFRKYACELIGVFALVFFAAGAVMIGSLTGVVPENLIGHRNPGVFDRGWITSRA
jgi:glycerol uptake facilitator-like aquaporin